MSGSASSGIRSSDQPPAIATATRKRNTRNRLLLHQSIVLLITGVHPFYIPPGTDIESWPLAICLPFLAAVTLTFQLPPLSKLTVAAYTPFSFGVALASTCIADIPIAGIAGIEKTTDTWASVTCRPEESR